MLFAGFEGKVLMAVFPSFLGVLLHFFALSQEAVADVFLTRMLFR